MAEEALRETVRDILLKLKDAVEKRERAHLLFDEATDLEAQAKHLGEGISFILDGHQRLSAVGHPVPGISEELSNQLRDLLQQARVFDRTIVKSMPDWLTKAIQEYGDKVDAAVQQAGQEVGAGWDADVDAVRRRLGLGRSDEEPDDGPQQKHLVPNTGVEAALTEAAKDLAAEAGVDPSIVNPAGITPDQGGAIPNIKREIDAFDGKLLNAVLKELRGRGLQYGSNSDIKDALLSSGTPDQIRTAMANVRNRTRGVNRAVTQGADDPNDYPPGLQEMVDAAAETAARVDSVRADLSGARDYGGEVPSDFDDEREPRGQAEE